MENCKILKEKIIIKERTGKGAGSEWIMESSVKVSITGDIDATEVLVLRNDGSSAASRVRVLCQG